MHNQPLYSILVHCIVQQICLSVWLTKIHTRFRRLLLWMQFSKIDFTWPVTSEYMCRYISCRYISCYWVLTDVLTVFLVMQLLYEFMLFRPLTYMNVNSANWVTGLVISKTRLFVSLKHISIVRCWKVYLILCVRVISGNSETVTKF